MRGKYAIALFALMGMMPVVFGGCTFFAGLQRRPEVQRANKAFDQGNYALAATLYESLSDRTPDLPEREELRLRQGIALYTLGSYHDARNVFHACLKDFPQGTHRDEVRIYLDKIAALLSPENPKLKAAIDAACKDMGRLQQLYVANPNNAAVNYAIGNLYYEMGNYSEAVRFYYEALTSDAAYKEKALIQQRMMLDDNGVPQPLTPADVARMERDNQPLVVFNTKQYMARDVDILRNSQNSFFNVTGLVRNQSSRFLRNATVEVRFLNTAQQIMDVAVVSVGAMGPGEVRPFRAEADSFDNIYNITHFDCIPLAEW